MHESDSFSLAFDYASGATGERFQNPLWPVTEMIFGNRFRDSVKEVKRFGLTIISNAVKSRENKDVVNKSATLNYDADSFEGISGSLINSLLDSIDDQHVVADAALNYLSAGT